MHHPHAAFPEAVLKAIRAECTRQAFRRRHCAIQRTKQMARCGENGKLPIYNGSYVTARIRDGSVLPQGRHRAGAAGIGRGRGRSGGGAAAGAGRIESTSISNCGADR
jgi:hypothetical protein